MKLQLPTTFVSVSIMLGVASVAAQESSSLVGADRLARAVGFLQQAAREIDASSNETDSSSDETDCDCVEGGGEFCGDDGQCHLYSCQAWYEFGPDKFTGKHPNSALLPRDPLVCEDIALTKPYMPNSLLDGSVYYPSVSFRCEHSLTPPPIAMGFNRRCFANAGAHGAGEFTCYELANTTDFESFLEEATPASLTCLDEDAEDGPKFTYQDTSESDISTDGHINTVQGFNATTVLDKNRALTGTMYAKFEEVLTDAPTPSPTRAPTPSPTAKSTASPTPAKSSATSQTANAAFCAVLFLATSLLRR